MKLETSVLFCKTGTGQCSAYTSNVTYTILNTYQALGNWTKEIYITQENISDLIEYYKCIK